MDRSMTRLLLIEDDPADVRLVSRILNEDRKSRADFRFEQAGTLGEGLDHLANGDFDVLLLDLYLPDSQGVDTVTLVRGQVASLPIVVFTAAGDDRTAVEALRAGAQDYVVKSELSGSLLRRSTRYAIERQRIALENERLHERLREAEKLESLGVLAGGVAFGFNNLLGAILEQVDVAVLEEGRWEGKPSWRSQCLEIRRNVMRAAKLAEQLRAFAGAAGASSGPVDLSGFLMEISDFLDCILPEGTELDYDLHSPLPPAHVNGLELRQLVLQLVINAAEAVGQQRGRISLSTGTLFADREYLSEAHAGVGAGEGDYVFLRVANTGRVMDGATRARIFDPFFTTKFAGRGLGLSAALGIARQCGGAIDVESSPEKGTVFTALFPCADRRPRSVRPPTPEASALGTG